MIRYEYDSLEKYYVELYSVLEWLACPHERKCFNVQ